MPKRNRDGQDEVLWTIARSLAALMTDAELAEFEQAVRSQNTQRVMAKADAARAPKGVGPAITIPRDA